MKLYCLAMVNAGIGVLLWIVIAKALKCAGEEISYVWIHYPLILNIPMIVMLILFFRAKRMARHSSEEIEVVEEVEYITFEKTENSEEWKMDEQLTPEQEKKSETRMETDF